MGTAARRMGIVVRPTDTAGRAVNPRMGRVEALGCRRASTVAVVTGCRAWVLSLVIAARRMDGAARPMGTVERVVRLLLGRVSKRDIEAKSSKVCGSLSLPEPSPFLSRVCTWVGKVVGLCCMLPKCKSFLPLKRVVPEHTPSSCDKLPSLGSC